MKHTSLIIILGLIPAFSNAETPFEKELKDALKDAPLIDSPTSIFPKQIESVSVVEFQTSDITKPLKFDINTGPDAVLPPTK